MDVNAVVSVVSSVGFPIVCCFGMAYYINTTVKDLSKIITDHTIAIEKLTNVIDNHEKNKEG